MNENPSASDWAAARGEKWLAQLSGMERMLAPVNQPLIRALRLDGLYKIADVGCGGGGTTLEILRRAPAGSVVHGFDISPALIEAARARVQTEPVQTEPVQTGPVQTEMRIAFEVADAATATPGRYQRLVSRFGIMFFDQPGAAFANLAEWLAPGGRFAFAAWGPLAENPWMTSIRDAVANSLAASNINPPPSDPEAPGPFRYADADKLLTLLTTAGFSGLQVDDWRGPLAFGGGLPAAEAANFALESIASAAEILAKAGDEALNRARQSLTARFAENERNGAVHMGACVHIVTGGARL